MKKLFMILAMLMAVSGTYAQTIEQQQKQEQANKSIAMFKQAQEAYEANDNATARKLFKQIAGMPSAPLELRDRASSMLDIIEVPVVAKTVSAPNVFCSAKMNDISSEGDFREMTIMSELPWEVTSLPSWCAIEEISRTYIKIWCAENPTRAYRSGTIVFSASGADKIVTIEQKPGVEKKGRVFFKTNPHNTHLSASDGSSNFSSSPLVFGVGEYAVTVSKDGYQSKDTVIVVTEVSDTTRVVEMELEPIFGKLEPIAIGEDGNLIQDVNVRIGIHNIEMADIANSHSFDDRTEVGYYNLYKEGVIPLSPGEYDVQFSADGYGTEERHVVLEKGKVCRVEVPMKFIMSRLVVKNEKNAEGAEVYLPELDIKGKIGEVLEVPVGIHQVEILKDGYLLDVGVLTADVRKGELTELEASMLRIVDLYVSTTVGGERVKIDGDIMGYQKPFHKFSLIEGETYDIEVIKQGYWHYHKKLSVSQKDELFDLRGLDLTPVDTLKLDSDKPNLRIKLTRKGDDSGENFAEGLTTPERGSKTELLIPYGKYKVVLEDVAEIRRPRKTVYRGALNFNEKTRGKYLNTWMKTGLETMRFLTVEGALMPSYTSAAGNTVTLPVKATVGEFAMFRGLSTSLLGKGGMVYTYGMDMPADMPADHFTTLMPALSLPFTNWDFRIGGGLLQHLDLSAFVSYAYCFDLDGLLQGVSDAFIKKEEAKYSGDISFDYFTGHDVFAGVEMGTRIKVFNLYLRAGLQYLKGQRYYCYDILGPDGLPTMQWKDARLPVNQTMFVVTLGFNIGSGRTKGQNILRVF